MSIQIKLFRKGRIETISRLQGKALLGATTNPGAMHTYKTIIVANGEDRTFTQEEKELIELLINREKEGGKNVAESRN